MDPHTCVDCKKPAPETDTQYTLIGSKLWRVLRRRTADGGWALDWRCPECWRAYKKAHPDTKSGQMPAVPAQEPRGDAPGGPRSRRS
jgi:hypothetical protein